MPIEICTVSGFSEFGKNMTAIRYKDEVVIIDMGIEPERYIKFTEDEEDLALVSVKDLVRAGAIPDTAPLAPWAPYVKAIVPGHAHLDHCGAIIYLADNYPDAPVICTPFTAEVIRSMIDDRKIAFKNRIVALQPNGIKKVSENLQVELIHMTHSTPQSSMVAVHTPDGVVLYASDFKFDMTPLLGRPPNFERLKELKGSVAALIIESTYGNKPGRTPSELVAREMLKEAIESADTRKNAIVVTTFSSHLARLKSILEVGHAQKRKVVFLGRSMAKYITAGENAGIINFSSKAEVVKFGSKVVQKLTQIKAEGKHHYLLVCTGHQGEPKSVLSKIITKNFLDAKDYVIFSCKTIPTPTNIANRERLERELKRLGIHVLVDVHQSGHGAQDELRELIEMIQPRNLIPSHGDADAKSALAEMAMKLGYKASAIHLTQDGAILHV